MKGRIARLEGSTRKSDASNKSLKKYVNMLEKALKERDAQVKALKAGADVHLGDSIRGGKEKESLDVKKKERRKFTRLVDGRVLTDLAVQEKPHNSFLDTEGDGDGDRSEEDPDRHQLKGFMDKTQGELTYLMVSPSNPVPPRDPPPVEEVLLQPPSFGPAPGQPSLEEMSQHYARQKNMRESNLSRPSPSPNHHPPPIPASNLAVRNPDAPVARSLADQQPLPQTSQQEWSSTFQMTDQPPEEQVTKINHSFDSYGREIDTDIEDKPQTEADGWDFNETAQFPDPETKAVPQRPDNDLFPIAQESPKSPNRGPASHRRKGSMSRRRSGERELSLNPAQKQDGGNFKVRFGLRGHLDSVRSVIFTGGGSPDMYSR
jgi:striatin 1/3/4